MSTWLEIISNARNALAPDWSTDPAVLIEQAQRWYLHTSPDGKYHDAWVYPNMIGRDTLGAHLYSMRAVTQIVAAETIRARRGYQAAKVILPLVFGTLPVINLAVWAMAATLPIDAMDDVGEDIAAWSKRLDQYIAVADTGLLPIGKGRDGGGMPFSVADSKWVAEYLLDPLLIGYYPGQDGRRMPDICTLPIAARERNGWQDEWSTAAKQLPSLFVESARDRAVEAVEFVDKVVDDATDDDANWGLWGAAAGVAAGAGYLGYKALGLTPLGRLFKAWRL
jgi:hypothetical protein